MQNTRVNQNQGVIISYEHLNKKYGFERQPRQAVLQLNPEDFLCDIESDSDTDSETENDLPYETDEENDQFLSLQDEATIIAKLDRIDCLDTDDERECPVAKELNAPSQTFSDSIEWDHISDMGDFDERPSNVI